MSESTLIIGNRNSVIAFSQGTPGKSIRSVLKAMTFMDPRYKGYLLWKAQSGKRRTWDGKVRFLTAVGKGNDKRYQFPTGLLSLVLDKLVDADISFSMASHDSYAAAHPHNPPPCPSKLPSGTELRPYQVEAVNSLLASSRGVCRVGTGGGKTEIICALVSILSGYGNKALILTHRTETFKNIVHRLNLRGITGVTSYGGTEGDTSGQIVVASIPKLWKNIKDPKVQSLLSTAQVLIGDEVHHAQSADSWYKLMLASAAAWRYGFTATVMMADEFQVEELRLRAVTGDVLVDIPASWLIEREYLARPRITMVPYPCRDSFIKDGIIGLVDKAIKHGPVLLIVKSLEEGNSITNVIAGAGISACFVQGVTSSQSRDTAVKALEDGELQVLVSSVIMKEGVDIPSVKSLINLCDEKKHRSAIQIVGRALRGGGDVFVYDPVFTQDAGAVRRAAERMRAYAAEGFEVRRGKAEAPGCVTGNEGAI